MNDTTHLSLRQFSAGSTRNHPIICLPHAGGGANFVNPLLPHLKNNIDVWAFEYPGHLGRLEASPASSLVALALEIRTAILDQGLSFPVIYGHSMGGKVAFEVARLLEDLDKPVHSLVVSGSEPPGSRPRRLLSKAPRTELIDEIMSMGGVPQVIWESKDFLNLFLEIIRGDYHLLENYRHRTRARLSCPIVALSGEDDNNTRSAEMAKWAGLTTAGTRFISFPGGHFFPSEHPSAVADEIKKACQDPAARSAPIFFLL